MGAINSLEILAHPENESLPQTHDKQSKPSKGACPSLLVVEIYGGSHLEVLFESTWCRCIVQTIFPDYSSVVVTEENSSVEQIVRLRHGVECRVRACGGGPVSLNGILFRCSSTVSNTSYNNSDDWRYLEHHWQLKTPGAIVGLQNYGSTCFVNSVLHCLFHTGPLLKGLEMNKLVSGSLSFYIYQAAREHWTTSKNPETKNKNLASLLDVVACKNPQYQNGQHDAHEFLLLILDMIHEELNTAVSKKTPKDTSGMDKAQYLWMHYKECNPSVVVDIFAGQLKSNIVCSKCGNSSVSFDPFTCLSLPIPLTHANPTVQDCFDLFTWQETLQDSFFCSECNGHRDAEKSIFVFRCPSILILHLKRFTAATQTGKINTPIVISEALNISGLVQECSKTYKLFATCNHIGSSTDFGHYTSNCYNPFTQSWNLFNDNHVTPATGMNDCYILFFALVD